MTRTELELSVARMDRDDALARAEAAETKPLTRDEATWLVREGPLATLLEAAFRSGVDVAEYALALHTDAATIERWASGHSHPIVMDNVLDKLVDHVKAAGIREGLERAAKEAESLLTDALRIGLETCEASWWR